MNEMKLRFKPEFLNRLDDIIMFKTLSIKEIEKIVDIFLKDINKRLEERHMKVTVTAKAKELIAKEGYDPIYGARPLKRYLENTLETRLARMIISGELYDGMEVGIDAKDDEIVIEKYNSNAIGN